MTDKKTEAPTAHKGPGFFELMQKFGKCLMLPISVLPIAGLLLGIGSSLTSADTIARLGAERILGSGTFLYAVLSVLSSVGTCIFDNLPLLFAVGVAIGFAEKDKEIAALAAVLGFLTMHAAISKGIVMMDFHVISDVNMAETIEHMKTNVLGMESLNMGVFGGILVGIGTAVLNNRCRNVRLPDMLAFFGGNRFIPIVTASAYVIVGLVMLFIWPYIGYVIAQLGQFVAQTGLVGTFLYDFIKRLLIPFGLHHVFYMPFWQSAVGGTAIVAGKTYIGAQNILFAQLADPGTAHISVSVSQYFSGEYPIMIFGLPAAAAAMYRNAKPENRTRAKSLLLSAALTSLLTGITEPIELPIFFVSPILYVFHAVMTGLSNVVLYLLNFAVGCSFSDGLIDLLLLGVLPGNAKTGWLALLPVGIAEAVIYYFVFDICIRKYDLKTPGREDAEEAGAEENLSENERNRRISAGLGGLANIISVDCCATRLRCEVEKPELVDRKILKSTGAVGVIHNEKAVQVVFGPKVNMIKDSFAAYMSGSSEIFSPLTGNVFGLKEVPDEVFSAGMAGPGIAVEPKDPIVRAPADGTVSYIAETKHAFGFETADGNELLIHLGIDTVKLKGEGFTQLAEAGAKVKRGDPIMKMDLKFLKANAPSLLCPVLMPDLEDPDKLEFTEMRKVTEQSILFTVRKTED